MLLERNAAHDEILTATADRRLARLGYDLHDGPTQDLIVLAGDLERLRRQVSEHGLVDSRIDAAFAELRRRIEATDESLRELAHSLQPQTIVERPLDLLLGRELDQLRDRYSIDGTLEIEGDLHDLTATQRITIFRTIQEALTNVREHSCATAAGVLVTVDEHSIAVRVSDDGVGFDVSTALESARLRGRMGVAGIGERVRMLGGIFSIDCGPAAPRSFAPRFPAGVLPSITVCMRWRSEPVGNEAIGAPATVLDEDGLKRRSPALHRTRNFGLSTDVANDVEMKVLIADDHRLIAEGIRRALDETDDFEVVGEANTGSQVMPLVRRTTPDLVLLDLRMPGMDGLDVPRADPRAPPRDQGRDPVGVDRPRPDPDRAQAGRLRVRGQERQPCRPPVGAAPGDRGDGLLATVGAAGARRRRSASSASPSAS